MEPAADFIALMAGNVSKKRKLDSVWNRVINTVSHFRILGCIFAEYLTGFKRDTPVMIYCIASWESPVIPPDLSHQDATLACQCNYKAFKWLKIITFRLLLFFCLINLQLHRIISISLSQSFMLKHSAGENFTRQKHLQCFDSIVGFLILWGRELNRNKIDCCDFYDPLPLAINMKWIFLKYSYFVIDSSNII